MTRVDIKSLTMEELEQELKDIGMPAYSARQIFLWLYKKKVSDFSQMTNISKNSRAMLAEHFDVSPLQIVHKKKSKDHTTKYQFALKDGSAIESVLIPMGRWHTLCVSTQAGCAIGCSFCLTGIKGFKRQLSVSEIINQLDAVQSDYMKEHPSEAGEQPISHIVFMGMGEPFANYDTVLKSIDILTSQYGYQYSHHRITVSTAGLVPQIKRFITESKANLAISLNAAYDDARTRLMPINKIYSINDIIEAVKDYHIKRKGWITFEYVMVKGINDGIGHAIQLVKLTRGFPCKVNLIPFNKHWGADYERPDEDTVNAFQEYLLKHGIISMIRTTRGEEIEAACGQLGG